MKHPLHPDAMLGGFAAVTPALLHAYGVRALLCDIDNTLVPYEEAEPTDAVRRWLAALADAGICIGFVSNNDPARVNRFNQSLQLFAYAKAGKPSTRAVRAFLAQSGMAPQQTALLGDQLFTDVLCARCRGLVSFLVPPIRDKKTLFFRTKRLLEKPFLASFRKKQKKARRCV